MQDIADSIKARINSIDPDAVAKSMMTGIETATSARWEAAVARAAALPDGIRPEKLNAVSASFARELAAVGAAAGIAAATPLVGTGASLMAATVELSWFTARGAAPSRWAPRCRLVSGHWSALGPTMWPSTGLRVRPICSSRGCRTRRSMQPPPSSSPEPGDSKQAARDAPV